MIRDVSASVVIEDHARVIASLILDADTGLVLAVSIGATDSEACAEAVGQALTQPASHQPPEPPATVVHHTDQAALVAEVLAGAGLATPPALVPVAGPLGEAEDIFDALLGHLAGRGQPDDAPTGGDWHNLYAQASRYCRAEPWHRWSDAEPFALEVRTPESAASYLAVVLGQAGIQRGLAVYPGTVTPETLADAYLRDGPAGMSGSLLFWLDAADEVPEDFVAKAKRYGWPDTSPYAPMPVTITDDRPSDLDRVGAQHLTVALAALVHIHGRSGRRRVTGRVRLAEDAIGSFTIGPAG
jgi:hypothetical protein